MGLSERYGWTPGQIADLTLPQLDAYLHADQDTHKGTPIHTHKQAIAFAKAAKEAARKREEKHGL